MKWVKANLFLLVCGLVVLAAGAGVYFVVLPMREDLGKAMSDRLQLGQEAQTLDQGKVALVPGKTEVQRPIVPAMVEVRKTDFESAKTQADQINSEASKLNKKGRVDADGNPLMLGKPQRNYLPVLNIRQASAFNFQHDYQKVFAEWTAQLVYGQATMPPPPQQIGAFTVPRTGGAILQGLPPTQTEVAAAWEIQRLEKARANTRRGAVGIIGAPTMDAANPAEQAAFYRQYLEGRVASYRMYGMPDMFQQRPMQTAGPGGGGGTPTEKQIFEGIVDIWIQQDIVNAIRQVNTDRQVYNNPVKFLERVVIGSAVTASTGAPGAAAAGGGGTGGQSIFAALATHTGATPGPMGGGLGAMGGAGAGQSPTGAPAGEIFASMSPSAGGPAPAAGSGGTPIAGADVSVTARTGSDKWDVTHFQLIVHIDATKLNQFIDTLYKQNNGYTVLNVKWDAIDPIEAASYGFLYGNAPVIRADITMEAMFFREWTAALMPKEVRQAVQPPVPDPVPPAASAPGTAPAAAPPAGV